MIKLRDLLKEQQAPAAPPAAAPVAPTTPAQDPAAPETDQAPGEETPPEEPAPEEAGAGEYDFTKDFRAYQDTVNKADNTSKKLFIKKANAQLTGKTVTANASRGYGQPKSDYTIKGVKKVSVDWYYKEDVVVLTDENDKKYFLTPGVNIKIEAGEAPEQPAPEEQPATDQVPQPEAPPAPAEQPPAAPQGAEAPPAAGAAPAAPEPAAEAPPTAPAATPEQPPAGQEPPPGSPEDLKKKKKKAAQPAPAMEQIQRDIGKLFEGFVKSQHLKKGVLDISSYVVNRIAENIGGNRVSKFSLEIPHSMFENFDVREFKLAVLSEMRKAGSRGQQFCEGSVDVVSIGRNYLFEFEKKTGWKE